MYIAIHVKYSLFLSNFNDTWIFTIVVFFLKNSHISNFMKILRVGAELILANWRTGLMVAFRNFANSPKN